ncbi:MAG: type II toxin-antitoxin system RatA family toxin [bacterium]
MSHENLHKSALVPYSSTDMLKLIADIETYPQFLSWCTAARILHRAESHIEAQLQISIAGVKQHFSTRNELGPNGLNMQLIEGPFKKLNGDWKCIQLGEMGCKVELDLEFSFSSGLLNRAFANGFSHVAGRLMRDFCERADVLYGS